LGLADSAGLKNRRLTNWRRKAIYKIPRLVLIREKLGPSGFATDPERRKNFLRK
jgi:hypothetical protein